MTSRHRTSVGLVVLLAVLLALVATSCVRVWTVQQRSDPDLGLVAEALAAGHLVLPQGARVVAVRASHWPDDAYAVTVVLPLDSVDDLLLYSNFAVPLERFRCCVELTADGSEILPGPRVLAAEESDAGPPQAVRRIVVDGSDPRRAVVHAWYGT
jgi:hypothetical protein